jgi:hypothetical protein
MTLSRVGLMMNMKNGVVKVARVDPVPSALRRTSRSGHDDVLMQNDESKDSKHEDMRKGGYSSVKRTTKHKF